ncbi:MAG: DUF456 family protein [Gemmatimonadetes bacterium]|nr:DUF456 family protein [Gemmatimonadota bacterium]MDA1104499.1 DUF456 family protein [Gemmatimonadota bacterium]
MSVLFGIAVVVALLGCLLIIPLGLPGLWLMLVIVLGLVLQGSLSWTFGTVAAAAAGTAELAEFVVLRRFGEHFGGSRRAFWGAVIGGMVGLFIGVPIPVIGPLVTAFVGTFVGAGLVTLIETRSVERSARVGWGLVLARTAAVALKVATGVAMTAAVGAALVL